MTSRSISSWPLLMASISTILGSGWLFSAYYTATLAGPASILSWLLGGSILTIVAFVFAEICAMFPITGSSTRIPQFTHGNMVCFLFSWLIWLAYAAMIPTEVQAVIQYLSFYFPTLVHTNNALTHLGYLLAICLIFLISVINIFSLRWLIRANNLLTVMKLIIPLFICIVLLTRHHVHAQAYLSEGFAPLGAHGVLAAITTGGIVFAFNGFKQACEMAGETKNPKKALPFAIIGSIVVCLAIYLLLQFTFLSDLTTFNLKDGWNHLHLISAHSPFAAIVLQHNNGWVMPILYTGAIVAPLAAGLMYMCSASRSLYGKSRNGHLPYFFQYLNPQGNPVIAIIACFLFGILFFFPLPGWNKMVAFLTSIMAITYAIAPICLLTLRKQLPNQARPFKLPCATPFCYLAFYCCNLMTYWSGWEVISKLSFCLIIGIIILLTHRLTQKNHSHFNYHWRASTWVWFYFVGISIISYMGNYGHGHGYFTIGWSFVIIGVFSIIIMRLATTFCLPTANAVAYIKDLNLANNKD